MSNLSRRDFLKLITNGLLGASGILAGIGLIRFLSYEPDPPPPQEFNVGSTNLYALDTRTVIKEVPAILLHTTNGFQALSLVCQHLGCTVEAKTDEFVCPCHGSRYALDGKVLNGPAVKALKSLKVVITSDSNVIIYKS